MIFGISRGEEPIVSPPETARGALDEAGSAGCGVLSSDHPVGLALLRHQAEERWSGISAL